MVDVASLQIKVTTDGIDAASSGLNRVTAAGKGAEGQNDKIVNSNKRLSSSFEGLQKYIGAAQAALAAFGIGAVLKDVISTAMEMDRLTRQFTVFTGSATLAAKEMQFVKDQANRLGLDMKSLTASYALFMNAVKGTANEGQKARDAFAGISEGMAAVGLTAEKQNLAWTQLNQGIMKGKFELEDLKSISEAGLPIFKLLADAMGVTTAQFMKMQTEGKVLSEEVLPLLGKSMHDAYAVAAVEGALSAQGAINKMNNAMLESKAVAGSALMPVFTDLVINVFTPLVKLIGEAVKGLQSMAAAAALTANQLITGFGGILTGKMFTKDGYRQIMAESLENEAIYKSSMEKIWKTPTSSDYSNAELMKQGGNKSDVLPDQKKIDAAKKAASAAEALRNKEASDRYQLVLQDQANAEENFKRAVEQIWTETNNIVLDGIADRKAALDELNALSDLSRSTQDINTGMIDDPYERQKQQVIDRYKVERDEVKKTMAAHAKNQEIQTAGGEKLTALAKEKAKATVAIDKDANKSKIADTANYIGMAGELFGGLADLQDQSSRKGFESAKAFNIAAAVMNTAAGIMNQFSAGDPLTAWARAALVGVMGAIQVAKIASTSFGGGGSVAGAGATGSFASSGGGSQSGIAASSPLRSVADSQTQESLSRLTSSTDNVAVAIGRLSKTMDDFTAMFQSGGAGYTLAINAPNINTALTKPGKGPTDNFEAGVKWGSIVPVLGTTIGAVIGGIMDMFGSRKWGTTAAGISLGVSGGDVTAQDYISQKKKGGWFSSDKKRTILSDNPDLQAYVGDMIGGYVNEIGRMALTLGTSADIDSYSAKATKIKTSGRKPEDIAKDLEDWTSKTLQGMALTVTGLESVAGSYANAYEQLKAYNDALVSTNDAFELIGKKQIQGNLVTAEFLNNMQNNLFGGMKEFTDAVDTYFSVMFTDTQQKAMEAAKATREVASVFASMPQIGTTFHRDGKWQKVADIAYAQMAIPKTREEFTKLVDSLDLTTEVGAQTFAALMGVSEAFATMTNAAEEAMNKLNTAFLDSAYDAASALKDILTGSLSTLTPQQQYMQQQAAFASAMANGNDAAIPGLSQSLLEASRAMFGSGTGYQSDYNLVTGQLGGMAGISGSLTLDSTERQIKVITEMRDKVDEGTKETVAAIKALQAEVAALRNQASADAKKQIIAVNANGTQVADTVSGIVTATARA